MTVDLGAHKKSCRSDSLPIGVETVGDMLEMVADAAYARMPDGSNEADGLFINH
jgi:hypothetical protein